VATLFSPDAMLNPLETWAIDLHYQRIRDQIKAMTKVDVPYAGMVRYFVKEFQLTL
jgi:hypothetical protein